MHDVYRNSLNDRLDKNFFSSNQKKLFLPPGKLFPNMVKDELKIDTISTPKIHGHPKICMASMAFCNTVNGCLS